MDILELQEKLDNLSAWRKSELIQAHFLAENAQNKEAKRYLCRAWVLIMYAHCDNFLKEATKLYLSYVKSNSAMNYKPELMWLVMRGKENLTEGAEDNYKSLNDYHGMNHDILFEVILSKDVFARRSFKYKSLRFFCDWILQIQYNHQEIGPFCESLKEKRDSIAHGEESYIDKIEDCLPWHQTTIKFIDTLKDSLLDTARNAMTPAI